MRMTRGESSCASLGVGCLIVLRDISKTGRWSGGPSKAFTKYSPEWGSPRYRIKNHGKRMFCECELLLR
jgi:hypothetical protein